MTASVVSGVLSPFPLHLWWTSCSDCCSHISSRSKQCKGFLNCASAFISESPAVLPPSAVDPLMKVAAQLPKVCITYKPKRSYKPDLPIPSQGYTVCYLTPCCYSSYLMTCYQAEVAKRIQLEWRYKGSTPPLSLLLWCCPGSINTFWISTWSFYRNRDSGRRWNK